MNDYKMWLEVITREIKQKYKVEKPQFIFDDLFTQDEERMTYVEDALTWPYWLKYCPLKENVFELKLFAPDPPLEMCQRLIDNFFKDFYETIYYRKELIRFTIFGDCTYTEKEMRQELLYLTRTGNSKLEVKDGPFKDDGDIVYFVRGKQDSIENMLKIGYLNLEYENE